MPIKQGATVYPKPQKMGGILIRKVIRSFKDSGYRLPLTSHILCAVSGGLDSVAMAVLISKYGRRIAPRENITLLHVNHGWRGKESDGDERFVKRLAKNLGVRFSSVKAEKRQIQKGQSWEASARNFRKSFFSKHEGILLTAHHADDLAETMLWRLFTGNFVTHGRGILRQTRGEFRPFLDIRKSALKEFLEEESQEWREDRTNLDVRFQRNRIRQEMIPQILSVFPQAVEHLVNLSLNEVRLPEERFELKEGLASLLSRMDTRLTRANIETSLKQGATHLPKGWQVTQTVDPKGRPRFVLENADNE